MSDVDNKHGVAAIGDRIAVMFPPRGPMTRREAMIFAAWILALACYGETQPGGEFDSILDEVLSS